MMPQKKSPNCRRRGFSLVELLTVIAIVALLVGIMFPVLGVARNSARRAGSVSNLHQIGVAIFMFAAEHNGHFPPPRADILAASSYASIFNWVGKRPQRPTAAEALTADKRALNKYLGPYAADAEVEVAHAPMDELCTANTNGGSLYDWTGSSYCFNYSIEYDDITPAGIALNKAESIALDWVVRPSRFVVGMETGAWDYMKSGTVVDSNYIWNGKETLYHLLFADGSVALTEITPGERKVDGSYTFTND